LTSTTSRTGGVSFQQWEVGRNSGISYFRQFRVRCINSHILNILISIFWLLVWCS
jgi:hypothetical protein